MTQDMNNEEIAADPEDKLVHLLKDIDKQIQNGTLSSETPPESLQETDPNKHLTASQLERLRKSQQALQFINLVRDDLKQRSASQRNPDSTIQEKTTPSDLPEFPGLNELDRFQIIRLIGQGGFAAVFLARDRLLERDVALKIPRPHSLSSPESVKRFQREAKAAALLSHPSIVSVYEAGNVGPIHYLVTDYCQGQSLGQWFKKNKGKINSEVAVRIVQRLAEAAQHAHQRGIIHRDLKPENILVIDGKQPVEDRLRVVDFGLAKRTDSEESMVTLDGAVVGTPLFMSPEQARGEKNTTHAADIFSLGVILYHLLTHQLPFTGRNNLAVLTSVESEDPNAPSVHDSRIARDLDAICMKCLEKKTVNRYQTAFDLAMDLGRYLDGHPVSARLLNPVEKFGRWVSGNRLLSGTIFLLFISLAAGMSLTTWKWMESESHLQTAKTQFDRAEKNIQLAQNTIQNLVGSLAEKLKETANYSQEALHLAEDALNVQKEILKDRPDHQETIFATAEAHFRVASIARLTSDFPKGVLHSQQAT